MMRLTLFVFLNLLGYAVTQPPPRVNVHPLWDLRRERSERVLWCVRSPKFRLGRDSSFTAGLADEIGTLQSNVDRLSRNQDIAAKETEKSAPLLVPTLEMVENSGGSMSRASVAARLAVCPKKSLRSPDTKTEPPGLDWAQ
eukprot:Selendium_serpulae@DN6312_c0_g1_i35.p1